MAKLQLQVLINGMNNKMTVHKFECGCKIPLVDGIPQIDFNNLNYTCPKTWKLYQDGFTESVFQLNSYLGKRYTKELHPNDLEDAAALISIIRPGTLQAVDEDGKSLTQIFCDRKNSDYMAPTDPLFAAAPETYGIIIYQETIMKIAQELAGFTKVDSLKFMKTCAKKDAEKLLAFEEKFVKGCESVGIVGLNEARFIFENIKASARYSFNKSHAVSYAILGFQTAWVKAHLPHHYLCAFLRHVKAYQKPLEEIRKIAAEARRLKIPFNPPSINNFPNLDFFIANKSIYFGLNSIKGCSDKSFEKAIEQDVTFNGMSWVEFLLFKSSLFNKTQIKNMIQTGCFDSIGKSRMSCEFEYDQWNQLTSTEQRKAREIYEQSLSLTLASVLENVEPSKKRIETVNAIISCLKNPPISLKDSKQNIVQNERELLGINISCSKIDRANIPKNYHSVKQINDETDKNYIVVGEIAEFREFKIKKGKLANQYMASFKLTDNKDECDVVCFPEQLAKFESALFDSNIVLIEGTQSNRGGLIINNLYEV